MSSYSTVCVGCKVNQYETQSAAQLLEHLGYRPAEGETAVSTVIVNTCCVTEAAARKSRLAIRRAAKRHPSADLVILGCYATERGPALEQVARSAGANGAVLIVGHQDDVAGHISRHVLGSGVFEDPNRSTDIRGLRPSPPPTLRAAINEECMKAACARFPSDGGSPANDHAPIKPSSPSKVKSGNEIVGTAALPPLDRFAGHRRAFVKVQDGCDAFCSYCVVPYLRRNVWSRPPQDVQDEVRRLVDHGHREIVLCGIFLGAYGQATACRNRWTGPSQLPALIRRLTGMPGLDRLRLSSLEPADVTDDLVTAMAEWPGMAPHLHLPLQSGSDRILKRMNRSYTRAEFLDAVSKLRDRLDRPAITTDLIVGFPGETQDDSDASVAAAREAGFSKMHLFPFSARPRTAAWRWRRVAPPPEVVEKRRRQLVDLDKVFAETYHRQFVGQVVDVLVEMPNSRTPRHFARGLTAHHVETQFRAEGMNADLIGKIVPVHITAASAEGLSGNPAGSPR